MNMSPWPILGFMWSCSTKTHAGPN